MYNNMMVSATRVIPEDIIKFLQQKETLATLKSQQNNTLSPVTKSKQELRRISRKIKRHKYKKP